MNYFIDNGERNINLDQVVFFEKVEINDLYCINFTIENNNTIIQWEFVDQIERDTCFQNLIDFVTP